MLIRDSLRQEMERELEEKTSKEIEDELNTCILIKKGYEFISEPSKWWEVLKGKVLERRSESLNKIWNGFDEKEKQEITTLLVSKDLGISFGRGHIGVLVDQMMLILQNIKERAIFRNQYCLLEARCYDIDLLIRQLENRKKKFEENLNHLIKERLSELRNQREEKLKLIEKIGKIFQVPQPETESDLLRELMLEKLIPERLAKVFDFTGESLRRLGEKIDSNLDTLPDPREMPCEKALELAITMRKEGRYPTTLEEITAEEHFSYPYNCTGTEACRILSRLHSVGLGKHLSDEEEYVKAEVAFREMQGK